MQPLADYLASLPASDNPNAFIFPRAASAKRTASLSNQFRDILVEAGLLSRYRADIRAPAKAATKRAKQARFRFTRYAISGDDAKSGGRF